jgi:hypothetical protein
MTAKNSRRHPFAITALLVLAASFARPAAAKDNDFSRLVRQLESTYHTHRSLRFLLGFGMVLANVARPEGMSHMKLALFADQKFLGPPDGPDFLEIVRGALGPEWQPFVEVRERNGERTVIYARNAGKNAEVLVATLDAHDAVLVQAQFRPDRMAKLLNEPHRAHRSRGAGAPEADDGPPGFGL